MPISLYRSDVYCDLFLVLVIMKILNEKLKTLVRTNMLIRRFKKCSFYAKTVTRYIYMILHCGVTIQLHVLESSGPATTNVLSHFGDTVELSV